MAAKKKSPLITPEGRTAFAKESEAAAEEIKSTALAIFGDVAAFDSEKFKRRNLPQMVKPGDVPIGAVVSGEVMAIVESPVSTIKGKLLHLKHASGQEFLFPCTGVIRNALAPGKEAGAELNKALEKEVGKLFFAQRQPGKPSKYKKEMFMFDVYTSDK